FLSRRSFFTWSIELLISNCTLFSSSVNFRFWIGRFCASNGSCTIMVTAEATLALSKSSFLDLVAGSTMYQFLPLLVSYSYQKRSEFLSQCGSRLVVKISFSSFLGEKREASW